MKLLYFLLIMVFFLLKRINNFLPLCFHFFYFKFKVDFSFLYLKIFLLDFFLQFNIFIFNLV